MHERALAVLQFWFGPTAPGASDGAAAGKWFKKDPAFDESIRRAFADDVERAARGELDAWASAPGPDGAHGALALVVLLDQFPRNLFRESGRAFAADARALRVTNEGRARGVEKDLSLLERYVFSMPLMHAEDRATQEVSVAAFGALAAAAAGTPLEGLCKSALDYAERHASIVLRFGRYPHRNVLLGRTSTEEEIAFLEEPGSSF